jgi:formylglycine-generating enzyme required for sulfatase activity
MTRKAWKTSMGAALAVAAAVPMLAARSAPPRAEPIWTRLEVVENSAEGPAYDRCQVEATLEKGEGARWRIFYGEARADSASGWSAIRPSSGCRASGKDPAAMTWGLTGSPYFIADVAVEQPRVDGREILLAAKFSIQRLKGFGAEGAPTYETSTEQRTVRVPEGSDAIVPILVADAKATDEFRVRELLLRFRAHASGSAPPAEFGELAVTADVPRAEIFLDGGPVGRTSADGPLVLTAVRTGDREVIVRDASGREARAVKKVAKGHRTAVALSLLKAPAGSPEELRSLGTNPQGGEEFWRDKDGAIVVRIPGGEFQMGSPDAEGDASEHPRHAVRVGGFLMDKTEVTWGQYKRFQSATSRSLAKPPIWGTPEALPVSGASWEDARAFCAWVGGRLPTESEWEREARGDDSRAYPWGNTFEPWRCNTRDGGPHTPTPAGAYPDCVSQHGVLDLAGSVAEWCSDWFKNGYDPVQGTAVNPQGVETGTMRAVRGGNWMSAAWSVRGASRIGVEPGWNGPMQGFRCVQEDRKQN